ncbi:PIN domain-containing protein [Acidicapsa acidisoli]|uniref:PIN domain-containing protein n=1 Tax=Acidicapsa acidisoli TaxID=1615681 RepID=UPI0021E02B67|nr:PIN domain-containing protein [Acidicapsa acidisoli]
MKHPHLRPIRLFLDANVLISASWKDNSKVTRLWRIPDIELITSDYVLTECKRNLHPGEQLDRLSMLLKRVRIIDFPKTPILADPTHLPEKDQPVLASAILARADFLVTGDRKHFGVWYGKTILGLRVEPPARFPEALEEAGSSD